MQAQLVRDLPDEENKNIVVSKNPEKITVTLWS